MTRAEKARWTGKHSRCGSLCLFSSLRTRDKEGRKKSVDGSSLWRCLSARSGRTVRVSLCPFFLAPPVRCLLFFLFRAALCARSRARAQTLPFFHLALFCLCSGHRNDGQSERRQHSRHPCACTAALLRRTETTTEIRCSAQKGKKVYYDDVPLVRALRAPVGLCDDGVSSLRRHRTVARPRNGMRSPL